MSSETYSADTDPHIFLPALGWCDKDGNDPGESGALGDYWSSTVHNTTSGKCYRMAFRSSNLASSDNEDNDKMFSVRAVRHK